MATEHIKTLIIGSGPAGYTAGIYASRSGISPVIYEGLQPGGQLTTTTDIDNFPGYPEGINGFEMMAQLRQQAERFGTEVRSGYVTAADFGTRPFRLTIDGATEVTADAVIVATGASAKYLGLPDEQKYAGQGVSACATCDGFFYRKKTVAVVGGGDTACEEASYLANLANKVYMIVRKDYLRATEAMRKRVEENPKIEILFNTNTVGLFGDNGVEGAHLVRHRGTDREEAFDIAIDGFFLAIGHKPNTDVVAAAGVVTDEAGYIRVDDPHTTTNIEGVFAAGDCADPNYRQAINAAAMGCRAAIDADHYLAAHNLK